MTDTAVEPKPLGVLLNTDRKVDAIDFGTNPTARQQEVTREQEAGAKMREALQNNPDRAREALLRNVNPPDFSKTDSEDLISNLGLDKTSGLGKDVKHLGEYIEKIKAKMLTGASIETADAANLATLLLTRGRLKERFPELAEAFEGEDDKLKKLIEDYVALDPEFARQMAGELSAIHEESKNLSTKDNPEIIKLEENKGIFETRKTAQAENVKRVLKSMGLNETQAEELFKNVEAGSAIKSILLQAQQELAIGSLGDRYEKINEYSIAVDRSIRTEELIRQKQEELERLGVGKNRDRQRADTLMGELARLRADGQSYKGQSDALRTNMISDSYPKDDFDKDLGILMRIKGITSEDSALRSNIDDYRENAGKVSEIEAQIKGLKPTETEAEKAEAEKKKAKLIARLERSTDTAVGKFLEKKYEDYAANQSIIMAASIKEAEAHNKDWKAGALGNIKQMTDEWSKYENGKYIRDRSKIGESAKSLAEKSAYGKDGVRQMLAEKTGFELDPEKRKDKIAGEVEKGKKYSDLPPELQAKVNKIIEQRTAEFEEIIEEQGPIFRQRLFTELNTSRGIWDKVGRGKLTLTDDEMENLNKVLGQELDNTSIGKLLKEKGWDGKRKWILLAIFALLAPATIGVVPAAGGLYSIGKAVGGSAANEGFIRSLI